MHCKENPDSSFTLVTRNEINSSCAAEAAAGPLISAPGMQSVPLAFYSAANLQISLLSPDGSEIAPGKRPPTGVLELAVAQDKLPRSVRTDERSNSRVVAVPADNGALVMSQ